MQRSEKDTEVEAEADAPDAGPPSHPGPRLEVTGTQVCASTLASVSAAVVASFFGVAGTIGGAAVVSLIATAGSAVYGHGIRKTGVKLQQTQAVRLVRPLGRWRRLDATREPDNSDSSAVPVAPPNWNEWLSQRRWGVVAGVAIVFVASLATVTLVELVGQQPLASIAGDDPSGKTSIGSLFDSSNQAPTDDITPTTGTPGSSTSTDSDPSSDEPTPSSTTGSETTDPSSPTTTGSPATTPSPTDPDG